MKTPIETMMDGVEWKPIATAGDRPDDIPYSTHEGMLDIAGHKFRCYRLNTGQAVFHADDVREFFGIELEDGDIILHP